MERALALGIAGKKGSFSAQESLKELSRLAHTAGAQVEEQIIQRRDKPDFRFYFGPGKLEEVREKVKLLGVELVFVDDELSPLQKRNMEQVLGVKVVDRTFLILDIFAQHARTKEGKLQVELAQCLYLLPRLTGKGAALSRLGGGIGTRGPGETRLEERRRLLKDRIVFLKKEVEALKKHRQRQRKARLELHHPLVALVGYTNAGKSTLLNRLARAEVYVADQLFATLDPTTRKVYLPSGHFVFLTDTVGFIRKLPHTLISSFYATLEEITYADVLLLVVDASSENMAEEIQVTEEVLQVLQVHKVPRITVLNKLDKLQFRLPAGWERWGRVVGTSAKENFHIDLLLEELDAVLQPLRGSFSFRFKEGEAEKLGLLSSYGKIQAVANLNGKIEVKVETLKKLEPFLRKRFS